MWLCFEQKRKVQDYAVRFPSDSVRNDVPISNVNYGALFTSFGWVIITTIYSFYINNYANYSVIYGGLANLVILLLWFYLLAYIFVIGLALNYREETSKISETTKMKVVKTEKK